MQFITLLYDGNTCVEIVVKWLDGSISIYEPTEDLITMYELLQDSLAYCENAAYRVELPAMCRWYEDTDLWRTVLVRNENEL